MNVKKKKNRKEYLRIYMQNAKHDSNFKAKELVAQPKSKENARLDTVESELKFTPMCSPCAHRVHVT